MQNPEELAQEALKFLEIAQSFEQEKKIEDAILNYQKAAEYLKNSGFLMHRIQEIYDRIGELKNLKKRDILYQRTQAKAQVEQLQDQAFNLLEAAKNLEIEGNFEDAIQQYLSAINLLIEAGWSQTQLENIKLKIEKLLHEIQQQKLIKKQQKEIEINEEAVSSKVEEKPQVVGMFGQKASVEKAEVLEKFKLRKKNEEEVKYEAFAYIDAAKMFENDKNYESAILNYERAMELLNSIGWTLQTQKIQIIIEKLKKDKLELEKVQIGQSIPLTSDLEEQKVVLDKEAELRKETLIEFETKKRKEEDIQLRAFNLIDIGNRLEREKKYDDAIGKLNQAIQLLKSIEWDSFIQPILNLIENIRKKGIQEKETNEIKTIREKRILSLQDSIYRKEKVKVTESQEDIDKKHLDYEKQRKIDTKKEEELLKILDKADEILKEKRFDEAINEYGKALLFLSDLGPSWESYTSLIKNTISNVEKLKNSHLEKEYEEQKKIETRRREELEFQKNILTQIDKERERLKTKEITIKDREEELIYFEQRKSKAFEFLNSALELLKNGDYDNAILKYINAGNIFAEIQWIDEIPIIEESIKEVEELKRKQLITREKEFQDSIERKKKDEVFQEQISKYLAQEREQLKKKEIKLMEREKEANYREERRKSGFKLLEEAQANVSEGNFDQAIEILQYALNFFAEAQWHNEINLIQNAIVEIENKKKEKELRKQVKFQADLEREKKEREFQEKIAKELKNEKDRLKEREIIIREKDKEIAYRESKKDYAFELLEKAQEFLNYKKYDEALQIYYNVMNIFAQIQWTEEIPRIREVIFSIENKKKEDEINKQKLFQKAIRKEAEDQVFIDRIKYQTEKERTDLLKEKELIEKQRQLSAENVSKQQKAFNLIDSGSLHLEEKRFRNAVTDYNEALSLLRSIGWDDKYLSLLNETIVNIKNKEKEKKIEEQKEFEISLKRQKEEEAFQKKVSEYMIREKEKLREKEIEISKKGDLTILMEQRKSEAFKIMDDAQNFLIDGKYEKSIEKYRDAEIILNEINFPTGSIREMITKIQEKHRERTLNQIKEIEDQIRREKEEEIFQQQILERIKFEEELMKDKQEKLRIQEELRIEQEKKKEEAFLLLEEGQKQIKHGNYDEAMRIYRQAGVIFTEIQWTEELSLIQISINAIEDKKHEAEIRKQQELQASLEKEKQEQEFQEKLMEDMKVEHENLKKKEIELREIEKEQEFRERRKEEAFNLLEEAQKYISLGKFDEAIEYYQNVANLFAQIQWKNEIPIIKRAINDLENKKREINIIKQKSVSESIEKEKEEDIFLEKVRELREKERMKALKQKEVEQTREIATTQVLKKQQEAFNYIDSGYDLLHQKKYENALEKYKNAIDILSDIGWTEDYLILLKDTVKLIEIRKRDLDIKKKRKLEILTQRKEEEKNFQKRISGYMQKEQERLKAKRIEIRKHEELAKVMETRKNEAFDILTNAEVAFNKKLYEQAVEKYREAELILNEIGFPTNSIREMIYKIQEKIREKLDSKQKDLEIQLKSAQEETRFQKQLANNLKVNEMKVKARQREIEKQKERQKYMERRKDEAFNLLEEADLYVKQLNYDKALDYYREAEVILNEIAFPTSSIRELIIKIQAKKQEQELQKQKELGVKQEKEREEWNLQQKITESIRFEQQRLKSKKLKILKTEEYKARLEERKEKAFRIIEEGEKFLKEQKYDNAVVCYRRAGMILNELHFPTDSINNMIYKIEKIKREKEEDKYLQLQKELERLEEERTLSSLIEERKRQEREKREAQRRALQEREKLIEQQRNVRESAYFLLDKAGRFLKSHPPNYNEAISLYIQARHLLAQNIGWEPELKNLDSLIKDLQQEQAAFIEKKRLEKQRLLQHQNEYALFQEEVKRRRLEQEKLKREKENQYRELIIRRQQVDQIKNDGLSLIDEGKKWARYHDFERAYKNFNSAISKFREIGWDEEIKYIETEIKNTKNLEEKFRREEVRIEKIQKQLEDEKRLEKERREKEEKELKDSIGEVSENMSNLISLMEERKKELKVARKQEKQKVIDKSKEFRSEMSNLINVKQELIKEIAKKEQEKREFQEKLEKAKEREKLDSLKKMIKDTAQKKKK